MKLFISWSKPHSKALAGLLRTWIPDVIQAVTPWMSQLDIDPGSRWSQEVSEQLAIHVRLSRLTAAMFGEKRWPIQSWKGPVHPTSGPAEMCYRMNPEIASWWMNLTRA